MYYICNQLICSFNNPSLEGEVILKILSGGVCLPVLQIKSSPEFKTSKLSFPAFVGRNYIFIDQLSAQTKKYLKSFLFIWN